jgi:hypothetical protein
MLETREKYRLIVSLLFLLCAAFPVKPAHKSLSGSAQVSILISAPCNEGFASLFGHTALRVEDPELKIDYVFNYGIAGFESNVQNFFRLLQGNHLCDLYALDFQEIENEHIQAKRQMVELVLNFSPEEKEFFWQSLLTKAESPGRVYYDVLKRNCTALPVRLIEKSINGKLLYEEPEMHESYQSLCDRYLQNYPGSQWLLDVSFGIPTNKPITYQEAFFIPAILKEAFLSATIQDETGRLRPLISDVSVLISCVSENKPGWFTPWTGSWLLLILIIMSCMMEYRTKKQLRWVDVVLFSLAGLVGIYLFYVNFIAAAWYAFPSWWLLCFHPLHLLGAVFCASKRWNRQAFQYHIFNLCALGVMVIGTCIVPQHYNPAFVPVIVGLAIRSAMAVRRRRLAQKKLGVH